MQKFKSYIVGLTLFFIPLFFLPVTHEFYNINKFVLMAIAVLLLLSISSYQFLKSREVVWSKNSIRILIPVAIFLTAVLLSTLIASTNKVQAAINFTYGPLILLVLTVFYWYVSREEDQTVGLMLRFSGLCISIITIVLLFHPLDSLSLPKTFQFLKNQSFSPVGARSDLILFLGFVSVYQLVYLLKKRRQTHRLDLAASIGVAISTIALLAVFFNPASGTVKSSAPINLSLTATIKSLSTFSGFVIGSGINNFSTVFTQVKDSAYSASPNWSLGSYDNASSAVLQILTESGILGLLALIGILANGFVLSRKKTSAILLGYMTLALLTTPASLIFFLLLYLTLALVVSESANNREHTIHIEENKSLFLIGFINTSTIVTLVLLFLFAFMPSYRAEVAMRSSVDAIANRNWGDLYTHQYNAVVLNPYIERYRVNFSQTNLFIAKQVATSPKPNQSLITSSVQQAINEAQAAIALNPKKAHNWENLGIIYKNVLGFKGAEQWAIAAFQKATLLDPQNVTYRLELGGVYYSLKQYENAIKAFQEATLLKPDLPNSYYNLAYAYYQNQDSKNAFRVMDTLLALLKKQSSPNYKKVLKERGDFASGATQIQAPTVLQ